MPSPDQNETNVVVARTPIAPHAPVVTGKFLKDGQLSFYEFLFDEDCITYCSFSLGNQANSAATMLAEFRLGTEFHYFGRKAGKLCERNAATKEALKEFVRRAYVGDREQRGVQYWVDISRLLWNCYCDLMARREERVRIEARAEKYQESRARKRAQTAERVRKHRAKARAAAWA